MLEIVKLIFTNVYLLIWIGFTVVLVLASRKDRRWRVWRIVIPAFLWVIATRPFVELALLPLEKAYPIPEISQLRETGVKDIVVLTGGGQRSRDEQLESQYLSYSTMYRYLGALELASRLGDDCRLIFSGAGKELKPAENMYKLTQRIQPERIIFRDLNSSRTRHHPQGVRRFLQSDSLILVTSAYHMPRSVRVFRQAGLTPLPYPVEFLYPEGYRYSHFFPSVVNLAKLQHALYFYLASVYYSLGG